MKYFSSDWHLGHSRIIEVSHRPFKNVDYMNSVIIGRMFRLLKKGDELYFLGDLAWNKESYEMCFDAIPKGVDFHWILGNHDLKYYKRYSDRVKTISHMKHIKIQGYAVTLCHYPMLTWNKSHYNAFMLYGHHHNNGHGTDRLGGFNQGKMLNVNCEFNDYQPRNETDILGHMNLSEDNWDYITPVEESRSNSKHKLLK